MNPGRLRARLSCHTIHCTKRMERESFPRKAMTPMQENQSRMTKPILYAGLLGGLLGGVASFAASRVITPVAPAKQDQNLPPVPAIEARGVAESLIAKLRTGQYADFVEAVKQVMIFVNEKEFEMFRQRFEESRALYHGVYGQPTGDFELIGESSLRPELVRFVYLEKFQRGAVAWFFVLHHDQEKWRLNGIVWNKDLIHTFPGGA